MVSLVEPRRLPKGAGLRVLSLGVFYAETRVPERLLFVDFKGSRMHVG